MKKNFLLSLFAMMMVAMVGMSFVSCSNDDDDENGGGNSNGGSSVGLNNPLAKEGNLLLTKVESSRMEDYAFEIKYDSNNRPVSFVHSEDGVKSIDFDYATGKMIIDGEPYGSVSFTSQGFVKEISYNYNMSGGDYDKGSTTCSYDTDGHLTKFDDNSQYKVDGEYGSGTVGIIFEWTNGNLNKFSYYESTNNGETSDEEWPTTIQYSNVENKFRQFTPGLLSRIELWDYSAIAGLYGIGPKKLPKMIVDEYTTTTFEYELNSDGSIRQEKIVTNYGNYGNYESTMIYTFFYTPAN